MESYAKLQSLIGRSSRPFSILARFAFDQRGAVSVEWVVVSAGVVAMAIALYTSANFTSRLNPQMELSYLLKTNGAMAAGVEYSDPSPLGQLIGVIQFKMIALRACLGFGITQNGRQISTDRTKETYCRLFL